MAVTAFAPLYLALAALELWRGEAVMAAAYLPIALGLAAACRLLIYYASRHAELYRMRMSEFQGAARNSAWIGGLAGMVLAAVIGYYTAPAGALPLAAPATAAIGAALLLLLCGTSLIMANPSVRMIGYRSVKLEHEDHGESVLLMRSREMPSFMNIAAMQKDAFIEVGKQ